MNTYFETILSGIIASLLAVILVEAFFWLKKIWNKRKLKKILGSVKEGAYIILPSITPGNSQINFHTANASSYIFGLLNKLNVSVNFIDHNQYKPDEEISLEIFIGMPSKNRLIKKILESYVKSEIFRVFFTSPANNTRLQIPGIPETLEIGGSNFDYGFIAKIKGEKGFNIFLISGLSDIATSGAAYFLLKNYKKHLFSKYGSKDFFVILKTPTFKIKHTKIIHALDDWRIN